MVSSQRKAKELVVLFPNIVPHLATAMQYVHVNDHQWLEHAINFSPSFAFDH